MTRVAGIDCGTNSIRLLIADRVDGRLTDVVRTMEIVRLGEGVDHTGRLSEAALERTFAAAERFAALAQEHGVERMRFVATSATRDAANRDEFVAGIQQRLGVAPEVIPGSEEAQLSFLGATAVGRDFAQPVLVVDIGGGSTEFVLGSGGDILSSISVPMGCVRMFERHLHDDPPTAAQVDAARTDIRRILDTVAAAVDLGATRTLVGLAGTVTTITAQVLDLPRYQPERLDGAVTAVPDVLAACRFFLTAPRQVRAARGFMHPGRVDVIGSGSLVWSEIIQRVQGEVAARGGMLDHTVTSEHDILDGITLTA